MSRRKKKFIPPPLRQLSLYPEDLLAKIPENHLVRVIDEVVDKLNIDFLFEEFSGKGRPPYHPRPLLKVILFAYTRKIYSYRAISRAMQENIYFIYLAQGYQPCFKSIHNFMTGRLKERVRKLFEQLIYFLRDSEYIDDSVFFVDGTPLRADANKYSYVWKKNTQRYQKELYRKISALLDLAEQLNNEEQVTLGDLELPDQGKEIGREELDERINKFTEQFNQETSRKKKRTMQAVNRRLKNAAEKLTEYEEQQNTLGKRNSYSRTDPDATFLRDKSNNLIPGYNAQISTQHGFVCHYTVSQSPSDQRAFHDHLQTLPKALQPKDYVGDAGYGTTANYMELEQRNINPYLKDKLFHREQSEKFRDNPFRRENFPYDQATDTYTCPNQKQLVFEKTFEQELNNGKKVMYRRYRCLACADCPMRAQCTKGKNRIIQVSETVEMYKQKARANLLSEKGLAYRKRRGPDVESVFGHLKHNAAGRRLNHRGLVKVNMELALKFMSYNLIKLAKSVENALYVHFLILRNIMGRHVRSWKANIEICPSH